MYNKYRHSHDRRKKKGSGSNLLSTCHCFKSGKAIQFISIHVSVNSLYFYIRAHCSDEVASDGNQAKRNSARMLLNSQLKDKTGALCSESGVSWSKNSLTIKLDRSNTSDSIMVPNASQMEMTSTRKLTKTRTKQTISMDCLRSAVDPFCCCSLLKLFFTNKCAYPKVRETIAWYLLCFWSTYVQEQHWNEHNAIACCQKFNQDVLPTFCWCSADLLLNS